MFNRACSRVAIAASGVFAFAMSGLAAAAVDTTAVESALTAAQASGEGVGGKVIAVVAGLVVVGVIIALVKKI